jgi:hypothetical protein
VSEELEREIGEVIGRILAGDKAAGYPTVYSEEWGGTYYKHSDGHWRGPGGNFWPGSQIVKDLEELLAKQ